MGKKYINKNVYDAAMERIEYCFKQFDNIIVAFSGGKDSGVMLNLVYQYVEQHGTNGRNVCLFHQDYEAQYQKTVDYVDRVFRDAPECMDKYWCCVPFKVRNAMSVYEPFWYPWDPEKRDLWVRDIPDYHYVHTDFDFFEPGMSDYEFQTKFGRWYRKKNGGTVCTLLGLRSQESLHRYSAIANKVKDYKGRKWITTEIKHNYSASPIYDWLVEDVWVANGRFGFDYNRLYDMYHKTGMKLNDMRVASPFLDQAKSSLNTYRIIDPDSWSKMIGRVNGANFGAIYGSTKAMGYKNVSLPAGHTWKSYTMFLLSTLPDNIRDHYLEKFETSEEYWKTTGGGFSREVIEEIRSCGYQIRENGVSPYCKDEKKRIVFDQEMPDETDDVKSTIDIPSWKRMCYCILKNDYNCRFMGFGPTKEQQARIKEIKSKYGAVLRGKKYVPESSV